MHDNRFYGPTARRAGLIAGAIALSVYVATLAPTVTLEDSGELAVAADYLGVPHPPGYPIWTLLAWCFQGIFGFVTFRGQPNPAWGAALASAVAGALAVGLMAMLVSRSGADLLRTLRAGGAAPAGRRRDARAGAEAAAACAGVSGALLFAFSPAMWSQSVIVEVYALNALFLALLLTLGYRWLHRPTATGLCLIALVFGLGLTNYQVLLLAMLTLIALVLVRDLTLFREFAIAAMMFALALGLLRLAALPSLQGFPKYAIGAGPLAAPRTAVSLLLPALLAAPACLALFETRRLRTCAALLLAAAAAVLAWQLLRLPHAGRELSPPHQTVAPFDWRGVSPGAGAVLAVLLLFCFSEKRTRGLGLAFLCIFVPCVVCLKKGVLQGLVHPTSAWFWFYVALNFVLLTLIHHTLRRGPSIARAILCLEIGLAFYFLMPLFSDWRNPPMNWGYALTWDGFKQAVTRGQYERIEVDPRNLFSSRYVDQLFVYLRDLRRQFTLVTIGLGLLPLCAWSFRWRAARRSALPFAIALAAAGAGIGVAEKMGLLPAGAAWSGHLLRLVFGALAALAALGLAFALVDLLAESLRRATRDPAAGLATRLAAASPIALALTAYAWAARLCAQGLASAAPAAPHAGAPALVLLPPVLLAAGVAAMHMAPRARHDVAPLLRKWLMALLAGFAALSLLLISLANLTGDLQDTFVQRVKFISAHQFFALWIAYGLALALHALRRRAPGATATRAARAAALLLPLIPLHQNAANRDLVREMGGAEQNGHDFGWQFGAYALRGAEALREECSADEEPPPHPGYPPPMRQSAIFFGGTDAGRFVPTYMIYSAGVRPDIHLITQNALAENTYVNVVRDLYGDDLWIPTPRDLTLALGAYMLEALRASSGAGAVGFVGPLVQVYGPQEVMKVNASIARAIFERNAFRHAFYVEESFAIPWMYPHLAPHGLVMEMHATPPPALDPRRVRDDLDFWDWYTRRLWSNPKFQRDMAARKAFSKLRSAIGGLYHHRGLAREAEAAYLDALLLYPANPEAHMRYLQHVLLPAARFAEARQTIERLHDWDPANSGIPGVLSDIRRVEEVWHQRIELAQRLQQGAVGATELLALVRVTLAGGRPDGAALLAREALRIAGGRPDVAYDAARIFCDAGAYDPMEEMLMRYLGMTSNAIPTARLSQMIEMCQRANNHRATAEVLKRHLSQNPRDLHARINLAVLQIILHEFDPAYESLRLAIEIGGDEARRLIREDIRLRPALVHEKYRPLLEP